METDDAGAREVDRSLSRSVWPRIEHVLTETRIES
jgi:hypothetical protein